MTQQSNMADGVDLLKEVRTLKALADRLFCQQTHKRCADYGCTPHEGLCPTCAVHEQVSVIHAAIVIGAAREKL